jgi:uncharacterized membrane protein
MDIISFSGRFHPLLVHLPIGIVFLTLILAFFIRKNVEWRKKVVTICLLAGVLSALLAIVTGFFLSSDSRYDPQTLFFHKWMGISVMVIMLLMLGGLKGLYPFKHTLYVAGFLLLLFSIGLTGHLGGNLTHGPDYLLTYAPEFLRNGSLPITTVEQQDIDSMVVYEQLIHPILASKCMNCHNGKERLGGLDVTSYDSLIQGGDNGDVIFFGNAWESELFKRISMAPENLKFMPPNSIPLSYQEVRLIEWWINNEGRDTATVASLPISNEIRQVLHEGYDLDTRRKAYYEKLILDSLPRHIFTEAQAMGWKMKYLSNNNYALEVVFDSDSIEDNMLEYISKFGNHITWLDISHAGMTDSQLVWISSFKNLTRLRLHENPLTNDGLDHLTGLLHLESLNLYQTSLTDSAVNFLVNLQGLKSLYLWKSGLSDEGINTLRQQLPGVTIDTGFELVSHSPDKKDSVNNLK